MAKYIEVAKSVQRSPDSADESERKRASSNDSSYGLACRYIALTAVYYTGFITVRVALPRGGRNVDRQFPDGIRKAVKRHVCPFAGRAKLTALNER